MRGRKAVIGLGLAAAVALGVVANLARRAEGGPAARVQVVRVAPGPLEATVDAEGVVEPVEKVEVRAPAAGTLAAVKVEEGDRVQRGEVLAVYDGEGLRQALDQALSQEAAARAQVAQLEAKLGLEQQFRDLDVRQAEERLRDAEARLAAARAAGAGEAAAEEEVARARTALDEARQARANVGEGDALAEQLAAARAALEVAAGAVARARADLAHAEVTAPVAGVVLSREGTRLGQVARGAVLFVLSDTSRLIVRAKVDEVDIGNVHLGDAAVVTHGAFPGREFRGKVTRIAPQAHRSQTPGQTNVITFDVQVEVDNREGLLRPGMSVDVRIVSRRKEDVLSVPLEAVVERGGRRGVFVLEGDAVRFRPVALGLTTQTRAEVTGGLRPGDQVVVGSLETLRKLADGQRARPE